MEINCANGIRQMSESEQRFESLIRQASVGMIVLTGEEMRVEIVNDMYGRLIGRTPEELQGKQLFSIIPEAERQFRSIIDGVRLSGKSQYQYDHPYRVFDRNGTEKFGYLNLVYQPYYGVDGSASGVMVLCHDVTEQVESRKRIQEAEAKLRVAIESGDLGTYELDMTTGNLTLSDRFKEIWGVEDNFSRDSLASKVHPDDQFAREQAHQHSLVTGQLFYEVRIISGHQKYKWVRINGRVLFDKNGKPISLLGVVQDISNQKDYTEQLDKLVQERTEELQTLNEELVATNEELSEANERLLSANRELEQFAYVASHDLQEPLRKLQTFSHLLRDRFSTQLNEGALAYVEKIKSSAARMSHLIKDLLDYSRLAHNKPLFQPIDLNMIITNVLSDYELLIAQKKATIEVDDLPTVHAIPIQMNQLFHNLIGNSLKFVRKTTVPVIAIKCEEAKGEEVKDFVRLKKDKIYFKFTVSDNGIGFSQQYADQIFSIFQQLNDKSKFGGYGIGLSLCKRIVENHSGVIYANGVENEGATFTFFLPVKHH